MIPGTRSRRCRSATPTTSSRGSVSTGTRRRSQDGLIGLLTGGDKFVVRGGYARTHDYAFLNLALNVASSFPYVAAINNSNFANAFTRLPNLQFTVGQDPSQLTRTVVAEDFRAPEADQYSLELQRELTGSMVFRVGYVGTQGRRSLSDDRRQPTPAVLQLTRVDPSARRHSPSRQRGRFDLPLAPDRSRKAAERRFECGRALHVE